MSAQNNSPNPRLPTQTPTSCSLGIFSSSPLSHLLSRRRIVLLCLRVLSVCANYCVSAVSSSHNRSVCLVRCQSLARTHRCHSRHQVKSWISCLLFCDRIRKLVHLDCIAILPFLLSKTFRPLEQTFLSFHRHQCHGFEIRQLTAYALPSETFESIVAGRVC